MYFITTFFYMPPPTMGGRSIQVVRSSVRCPFADTISRNTISLLDLADGSVLAQA